MIKIKNGINNINKCLKKVLTIVKKERTYSQTTFCYCPSCRNELVSNHKSVRDEECVTYICGKCGKESKWDFDSPIPFIIK